MALPLGFVVYFAGPWSGPSWFHESLACLGSIFLSIFMHQCVFSSHLWFRDLLDWSWHCLRVPVVSHLEVESSNLLWMFWLLGRFCFFPLIFKGLHCILSPRVSSWVNTAWVTVACVVKTWNFRFTHKKLQSLGGLLSKAGLPLHNIYAYITYAICPIADILACMLYNITYFSYVQKNCQEISIFF